MSGRIVIEPICVTPEDFDEWLSLFANRNEVAHEYADLLLRNGTTWAGWADVNQAILRRWSMAGLKYIKERAWKIARASVAAGSGGGE